MSVARAGSVRKINVGAEACALHHDDRRSVSECQANCAKLIASAQLSPRLHVGGIVRGIHGFK